MKRYQVLAGNFTVGIAKGKKDFLGPVIVSEDAFFLCMNTTSTEAGVLGGAGPLGLLLYKLFKKKNPDPLPGERMVADLPPEITSDKDWPKKQVKKKGRLIILPRTAITQIDRPKKGHFDLVTEDETFRVPVPYFGRQKKLDMLADYGWSIPEIGESIDF